MRTLTHVSLALLFVVSIVNISMAADGVEELKEQTLCPVMGGKITKDVYVDHDGQRIFFCCQGCESKFKADPDTYLKKMAANGEMPMSLKTCSKCGEYKGTKNCCKRGAKVCNTCGMHKGSPGCCADMSNNTPCWKGQMESGKACCAGGGTKACAGSREVKNCQSCGNAPGSAACKTACMKQTS